MKTTIEKCQKCKREFSMPKGFSGIIICEDCDPAMNPQKHEHKFVYSHKESIPNPSTTSSFCEENDVVICEICGVVVRYKKN